MAASEHIHIRQDCVAGEITVKQINQYSYNFLNLLSTLPGQGSASVFASYPIPFKWCKCLKDAEQSVDVSVMVNCTHVRLDLRCFNLDFNKDCSVKRARYLSHGR